LKEQDLTWALRRAAIWFTVSIVGYVLTAGFAWRWVLGIDFPLWKLLVVAVVHGTITFLANAFFPSVRKRRKP
jgi:hypothetical protein